MEVEKDTLAIARTLGKAGMEQGLAETVVDTLKAVVKPLATTNDVERVGERMKGVEGRMKGVEDRMGRVETSMEGFRIEMREFKVEMKEILTKTEAGMKDNIKSQINSMKWFFGIAIGLLGLVGLLIKLFA